MSRYFILIVLYSLLLGFPSVVHSEPVGKRTCRVLFVGNAKDVPRNAILFDGTSSQEIELPTMNLSPVYELPDGPRVLRLLDKKPGNPKEIPAGAPKVKLKEKTGDFYLLVTSDSENKILPVALRVIDADQKKFRKGQTLWFNLTTSRVGGKLGSEKLALAPNSRKISAAPAQGAENYTVELYYQVPGERKQWPLCETQWQHNPAGRTVVFVLSEAGSQVPRIMGFPDFRVEEKRKEGE